MKKATTREMEGLDPVSNILINQAIGERAHKRLSRKLAMERQDPLIRAAKKAYRSSLTGKLDGLFAERSRWLRKQTIASNKLLVVENDIRMMLVMLVKQIEGPKPENAEKGTANEKA